MHQPLVATTNHGKPIKPLLAAVNHCSPLLATISHYGPLLTIDNSNLPSQRSSISRWPINGGGQVLSLAITMGLMAGPYLTWVGYGLDNVMLVIIIVGKC